MKNKQAKEVKVGDVLVQETSKWKVTRVRLGETLVLLDVALINDKKGHEEIWAKNRNAKIEVA